MTQDLLIQSLQASSYESTTCIHNSYIQYDIMSMEVFPTTAPL